MERGYDTDMSTLCEDVTAYVGEYLAQHVMCGDGTPTYQKAQIETRSSRDTEWIVRNLLVEHYAWAVPSQYALREILTHGEKIVEVGAGKGYWAQCLRELGGRVTAYDIDVPEETWGTVLPGDTDSVRAHPDATLFLCWPPYNTSMARDVLRAYTGDTVAYVGEGWHGCTADDEFHDALEYEWEEVDRVDIPTFPHIHDCLYIYKRR